MAFKSGPKSNKLPNLVTLKGNSFNFNKGKSCKIRFYDAKTFIIIPRLAFYFYLLLISPFPFNLAFLAFDDVIKTETFENVFPH